MGSSTSPILLDSRKPGMGGLTIADRNLAAITKRLGPVASEQRGHRLRWNFLQGPEMCGAVARPQRPG
ncbi:hypothetical protein MHYP_G00242080 [Metynnis hypsauchen]